MTSPTPAPEQHRTHRIGWLRAAVLGANDGIVSTASLLVGVAAAGTGRSNVLIAGIAGLVSGGMSMAAGEYVSVSSQSDTENADLEREKRELAATPELELRELQGIYVKRGLDSALAMQVSRIISLHEDQSPPLGNGVAVDFCHPRDAACACRDMSHGAPSAPK